MWVHHSVKRVSPSAARSVAFTFFAMLAPVIALPSVAAPGDVAIVVRSDVPAEGLSFKEVHNLVLGDRQFWDSNLRLTLLIQAPSAREREVLLKTIYQMTEAQFRQY